MKYSDIVKETNPIAFKIIDNSFKEKKLPHAYLFAAHHGQKINEEILFVAQRLIDRDEKRDPLKYPDINILDGSTSLIKKEDVLEATTRLQQTALDATGVKILVIKNIENSNKQSLNSLLKFLEEPTPDTYILISTNNLSSVLPTIKSRSQIISLKPMNINATQKKLEESGINKKYSRLLANIYDNEDTMKLKYDDNFKETYKELISILKKALSRPDSIITELPNLIKKDDFRTPILMLSQFINDIWRENQLMALSFPKEKELIQKYELANFNIDSALMAINEFMVMRNYHVNFDLYRNQLLIKLGECYG
ncbi:MAG: hypothetical protein HRT99_03030 [Mycoplasmatales bacterium]|nr:hypothetical protein [Mycoplasmatales bacterium]